MKKISLLLLLLLPNFVMGVEPSTECPAGTVRVGAPEISWFNDKSDAIAQGWLPIDNGAIGGYPFGCLDWTDAQKLSGFTCVLYAPAGVEYTDDSGEYQYEYICPLN